VILFVFRKTALAAGVALMAPCAILAQHGHLNIGAAGTNPGDRLIWDNGADFIDTSGYVKTLTYTNGGRFAGYFQQNITLTVLPATAEHAGPDPAAPALGSFIQFRLVCLEAPAGGEFGFWDAGSTNPSISLAQGMVSMNLWRLTEADGSPGTDPYGHIHGRRFTATKPGLYRIGFTALDTSTNGPGGGPIHTGSVELPIWFQAGVNVSSVEPDILEGHVHVRFAATAGYSWQVEASTLVDTTQTWTKVGSAVTGADLAVEVVDPSPPVGQRFYRVVGTPIIP
jgi:hypothetical protein